MDPPAQLGDVLDADSPLVDVAHRRLAGQSDLDTAVRQRTQVKVSLGIPLDAHRRL
jgi:hypothetical protein